jgi:hypothetical protein
MEANPADSNSNSEALREEVTRLRQRVQHLEEALAGSRRALIKAFYVRQPLPFSEQELAQIATEEKGVPLEEFISELENAAQGQQP